MWRKTRIILALPVVLSILVLSLLKPGGGTVLAQQPTGSVPTVTGTAEGPVITVDQSIPVIRVYAGPSSFDYPSIGVLLGNEKAPAVGRARDREDWIQIIYHGVRGSSTGWVYGLYVSLSAGARLPLVDIPATPTPLATPTINPTLQAAFIGQQTPTRLPTFTPAPQIEQPSFVEAPDTPPIGIPTGLLILSLGLFGFLGAVISYLRGR